MDRTDNEYNIDLMQVCEVIKKNIILYVVICLLTTVAGFLFSEFFIEEKYQATAQLIVVSNNQESQKTVSDINLSQKLVDTYSAIIMSEAISEKVIDNLQLDLIYNIDSEMYQNIVKVSSVNSTEVMNITVKTNNGNLSALIANEVVKVFENEIYNIMNIDNVTTLVNAKAPLKKYEPSNVKYAVIGGFLGVVICAVLILIELSTDTKVKTEDDVKKILNYPIIGSIPEFDIEEEEVKSDE